MSRPSPATSRRIKYVDRAARWVVTLGGVVVIVSVLGIVVSIVGTAVPLFLPIRAKLLAEAPLPNGLLTGDLLALGLNAGLNNSPLHGLLFQANGDLVVYDLLHKRVEQSIAIPPPQNGETKSSGKKQGKPRLLIATPMDASNYALTWSDGSLSLVQVSPPTSAERGQSARKTYTVNQLVAIEPDAVAKTAHELPTQAMVYRGEGDSASAVALYGKRHIVVTRQSADLSGSVTSTQTVIDKELPDGVEISCLAMDRVGRTLYAGTREGSIFWWRWDGEDLQDHDHFPAFHDKRTITSMKLALGDVTLVVGDAQGDVTNWFLVRSKTADESKNDGSTVRASKLRQVRALEPHSSPIEEVVACSKNRAMLVRDQTGCTSIDFTTSERRLVTMPADLKIQKSNFAPRGDVFVALTGDGKIKAWSLAGNFLGLTSVGYHPEVSWSSLWEPVWYENHDRPEFEWQSTGDAEYEPKLSVVPLVFGTLKGTFYAMLLAGPLALAAAAYVSHFASPRVKAWVKPIVEMMAAVPSVILGFFVGLWLAPRIQIGLMALGLTCITAPLVFLVFLAVWQFVARSPRWERMARSREFIFMSVVILVGVALAIYAAGPVEQKFFGGNLRLWMYKTLGLVYDPKNSILIAFGVGFMVIPVIFSLAEDALSSIPNSMTAASMALGASRWQTLWRVVLPSASPGIFAATMIGFGRAVGETMVFVSAVGATAIIDPSPFNGMRTLSANIAQEIPEAAVGSTHRRILFLSAVILLLMTSALNTVAEVVRQRLRKRYGQL